MALQVNQQLEGCKIVAGGSVNITTAVTALTVNASTNYCDRVITYRLDQRKNEVGPGGLTLLEVTAKLESNIHKLMKKIREMLDPPDAYAKLETTLDQIRRETIPSVALMYSYGVLKPDSLYERKVFRKVNCMNKILENFTAAWEATFYMLLGQLRVNNNILATLLIMWNLCWWIVCPNHLIADIHRRLDEQRVRLNSFLLEMTAPVLASAVSPHQIMFSDFFGGQWSLPKDLCLDRDIFESTLRLKYKGGPAAQIVAEKHYHVFIKGDTKILVSKTWETTITSGCELQLSVVMTQHGRKRQAIRCPRCPNQMIPVSEKSDWVRCYRCDSAFNVSVSEAGSDGIDNLQSPGMNQQSNQNYNQNAFFKSYSVQMTLHELDAPISPLRADFSGGIPFTSTGIDHYGDLTQSQKDANGKTYAFVALPGNSVKKRPRRRYDEIERLYRCSWPDCTKSYGTLNHLNAHVTMQKHGPKRSPSEFEEMRKQWRKQKKEQDTQQGVREEFAECSSGRYGHDVRHSPSSSDRDTAFSIHGSQVRHYPELEGTPSSWHASSRGSFPDYMTSSLPSNTFPNHSMSNRDMLTHMPARPSSPIMTPGLSRLPPNSTLLTPLPGFEHQEMSSAHMKSMYEYYFDDDGSVRPGSGHRNPSHNGGDEY